MAEEVVGGAAETTSHTRGKPSSGHKKTLTGKQKAAVFLVTLGAEVSSEIFKHLREDEIETLTFEIARVDVVEPEDRDRVLMEFQELMMAKDFITSGIDYAKDLLENHLAPKELLRLLTS